MATKQKLTLREIDALVAEKVMGWTRADLADGICWFSEQFEASVDGWNPTTEIMDAWSVVEKMVGPDRNVVVNCCQPTPSHWEDTWHANIHDTLDPFADNDGYASTAPLAICLAALRAHGIDVEAK